MLVRAPYLTSVETIENFVRKKEQWIRKHTEKHKELTGLNRKQYADGDTLLFLGREYRLKITYSTQSYVNQYDNIIEAGTGGRDGAIKVMIDIWYRKSAEKYIYGRFREILARYSSYGFRPAGLTVRPLKSRWGSCTSKGKITINSELIKLDEHYIDYVIIHELCHLKYHNHGKDYHRLLEALVPDYEKLKKELRKYYLS